MIDVVYRIGQKCEWDTNYSELRYSLRSIEENFTDLRNVYIIGNKPNWLINVKHIHIPDCYKSNKDANLINKVILACTDINLSDDFLQMSDDMYLLQKVNKDFFEIPYIDNNHVRFVPGVRLSRWKNRLKRTVDLLKSASYRSDCFEAHVPYMINKHLYPKTLFRYDYGFGDGYCGNTLYFNTIHKQGQIINSLIALRIASFTDINFIKENTVNRFFFNFDANSLNNDIKLFLSSRFDKKSSFEE